MGANRGRPDHIISRVGAHHIAAKAIWRIVLSAEQSAIDIELNLLYCRRIGIRANVARVADYGKGGLLH